MAQEFEGCCVVHATDKAIRVIIPDIDQEPVWVPKWTIEGHSDVQDNEDKGLLILCDKFCEEEGWV